MKTKRGGFMIGIGAAVGIMLAAAGPVWADFPVVASGGSYTNNYPLNGVTYRAHVFTNTGDKTFTVTTGGAVEVLVVGGGGGGGYNTGSGGGGGGWVTLSTVTLTNNGSYTVTVGAGGARSGANGTSGTDGNPSMAFGLTAPGGSGGGSIAIGAHSGYVGGGGSGGGVSYTNAGTGSLPGGKGGNGNTVTVGTGGGGGANGNGQAATASKCGDGGVGVTNDYLNGTSTGYGGGGGGGTKDRSLESFRGLGVCGGGNGCTNNEIAGDGTPGTGGGGGGQGQSPSGGNGGSGIVIVRYATAADVPLVYTLEATDLTTNSATLNGTLTYLPGGQTNEIRVYWGTNDMGKTAAGWMGTNVVATGVGTAPASYSYTATSLSTNLYYYRYYATNTAGSGEYWGDVRKFELSAPDLGLAVYGYRTMTIFQWQDSEQGTSWSDVTNGTNSNLRVTKVMYTAKPYYRVRMMLASLPPVYSGTAKLTEKDAVSGTIFLLR